MIPPLQPSQHIMKRFNSHHCASRVVRPVRPSSCNCTVSLRHPLNMASTPAVNPAPPSLPAHALSEAHTGPSLDPATYPHLWSIILVHVDAIKPEYESLKTRLAVRATCVALRDLVSSRMYNHVAAWQVWNTDRKRGRTTPRIDLLRTFAEELFDKRAIPGLDWNGGDAKRQLCVGRLAKYCRTLDLHIPEERIADSDDAEVALFGQAVSNITTLRVQSPNEHSFTLPRVTTVVGFTEIRSAGLDYQDRDVRWGIERNRPPKDRRELAAITLNPVHVPPSTRVIIYSLLLWDGDRDHGNNNMVVRTDLGALPHLTDVAFAFSFEESLGDHRPHNHKPLGLLNSLVRSVAASVPRVRVTLKGLEWFPIGWFCDASLPDPNEDNDGWAAYLHHYIARYIFWVNSKPGLPGESYFKWAARVREDDKAKARVDAKLEPILAAVSVETGGTQTLMGSKHLKDMSDVPSRLESRYDYGDVLDPPSPARDYRNLDAYCEPLDNHGDDDFDGSKFYYGQEVDPRIEADIAEDEGSGEEGEGEEEE